MIYKSEKKPDINDIYSLYNFYGSYKEYYSYYWSHINQNVLTKDDIDQYRENLIKNKSKLGGPIEALCMFAQIPKSYLFNPDGTPKELNELEVLDMIMEANYGKTDN